MEFYRAVVLHLIQFYFESAESFHQTFGDALNFYSERFGREPKLILSAIGAIMAAEGFPSEQASHKEACRQKVQDLIFTLTLAFEASYVNTGDDPTRCARVRVPLTIPADGDRDRRLQEIQRTFTDIDSCRESCTVERIFRAGGKYARRMSSIAQIVPGGDDRLTKICHEIRSAAVANAVITCHTCEKMGDAVIAVSVPPGHKLHTLDTLHRPLCQALGQECEVHPSVSALKKNN
jgi:hypothetical protein